MLQIPLEKSGHALILPRAPGQSEVEVTREMDEPLASNLPRRAGEGEGLGDHSRASDSIAGPEFVEGQERLPLQARTRNPADLDVADQPGGVQSAIADPKLTLAPHTLPELRPTEPFPLKKGLKRELTA